MLQINNTTWVIDTKNPDSNGETFNKDNWRSMAGPAQSVIEKDWRDYFKVTNVNEYMKKGKYLVVPGTSYSEPKRSDELELIWTQVTQAIKQYSWRAIYAKNDGEFNYHVSEMIRICKNMVTTRPSNGAASRPQYVTSCSRPRIDSVMR